MDETMLHTIAQLQDSLKATHRSASAALARKTTWKEYVHISRVLKRFDYPHRKKPERSVVPAYHQQHTSGYSRAQIKRLVARWHKNRLADTPLVKRYRAPVAHLHARKPPATLICS